MASVIQINQNDAGLIARFVIRDEENRPVDLTQYQIDFEIHDGATLVNAGHTQSTKPDAEQGIAEYTVQPEDSANPGVFRGILRLQNNQTDVRSLDGIAFVVRSLN